MLNWREKPVKLIPQQMEQAVVARRVDAFGAGIALAVVPPFGQVEVETLRATVDRVLGQPEFRQKASQLGDSLRDAGGSTRAADEILAFVRRSKLS